jgi:hypothetical protein
MTECGHPFTKEQTSILKEQASIPAFLESAEAEGDDSPQPYYLTIFRIFSGVCLFISLLFGIGLIGFFRNPSSGRLAVILVGLIVGILGFAFFQFLSSNGKRG